LPKWPDARDLLLEQPAFGARGKQLVRFAGFELDHARAELRTGDGTVVRLRPKTFDMLGLFVASPGRVLSKQELMEAIWPNIHVGEDSLFQCIRELRTALGDDQRQMIKLVSGQGYLFDVDVTVENAGAAEMRAEVPAAAATPVRRVGAGVVVGLLAVAGVVLALAIVVPLVTPRPVPATATIAVMPLTGADTGTAASVTTSLTDGLAKIDNLRVAMAPGTASAPATDYVVTGELIRDANAWTIEARMVKTATREVQLVTSVSVDIGETGSQLQRSRLAAGLGHELALRLNLLLNAGAAGDGGSTQSTKVVIEQATAFLTQTSPERFGEAQHMLEAAIAADPENTELAVALAALQLRGIQMVWYSPEDSLAAEASARSTLERARRLKPSSIAVLEAYCRFLNATTRFAESLVVCAQALSFDPWNGIALYHIGLAQLQLGRFEDALATFRQADEFDTPQVSRWTWLVGAGWVSLLMDHDEAAIGWLQRSIAITPASGRPLMLLAAAYQRLGRQDEAEAALSRALALRPGTTALNVAPPTTGASPVFLAASTRIIAAMVGAGLPER
jgi:DNA-binding winged helix-turn-helix (wHTH) protein/tetratricopeptide (TPR) repeat protein